VEGITNLFGPRQPFRDALAAERPGAKVVCYERGDDLLEAAQAGFEPLGGLKVWASSAWSARRQH
jgi:hypothetical protein